MILLRLFILLAVFDPIFAAEPRLSLIQKFTQGVYVLPRLVDLDGDGDLDIYSGNIQRVFADRGWHENLGDNQFSPPKAIDFRSSGAIPNDVLMQLDDDPAIEVIAIQDHNSTQAFELQIIEPLKNEAITVQRSIFTPPADEIAPIHLDGDFSPQFILLTKSEDGTVQMRLETVTNEQLLEPWSSQILSFTNPRHQEIEKAEALDLDDDGDRDLFLIVSNPSFQTYIFERTAPNAFAPVPLIFDGNYSFPADLNDDGVIELHRRSEGLYLEKTVDPEFRFEQKSSPSQISRLGTSEYLKTGVTNALIELDRGSEGSITIDEYQLDAQGELVHSFSQTVPAEDLRGFNAAPITGAAFGADFNGDGKDDLLLLENKLINGGLEYEVGVFIFQRSENGFEQIVTPPSHHPLLNRIVESGDFDEDGDVDLIIGPDGLGRLGFFQNDGDGNFSEAPSRINLLPAELDHELHTISSAKSIDVNVDGHLDLAVAYQEKFPGSTRQVEAAHAIVHGNGDGSFDLTSIPTLTLRTMRDSKISSMVDWDGDGDLDAIIEGGWLENVEGLLSFETNKLLENAMATDVLLNPFQPLGHAVADVDGDGHPDYVALAFEIEAEEPFSLQLESKLAVGFNDGSGGIEAISTLKTDLVLRDALGDPIVAQVFLQDLNLDEKADFLLPEFDRDFFGNPVTSSLRLIYANPDDPRDLNGGTQQSIDQFFLPEFVVQNDFDADGTLELGQSNSWIRPTPDGPEFGPIYDALHSSLAPLLVADFDGDGDLDSIRRGKSGTSRDRLVLVQNPIIDERSSITADLIELGQPAILATPEADPDNDGLNNADEYLLGTDPLVPDADLARDLTPQWSANQKSLTFPRRKDRENHALFYDLQASDDLLFWSRISQSNATVTNDGPDWELVTITVPERKNTRFFRVSASHDPGR